MSSEAVRESSDHQSLEALLQRLPDDEDRELVLRAYEDAARLHVGQTRKSGEPYIEHPLAVAWLLAELRLDAHTVAAGLLHDVLEDTQMSREELRGRYPESVTQLVEGVTKISQIDFKTSRDAQIENLRKIIMAMARDIRVLVIKLCDRLHNMRTLKWLAPEKRVSISRETLDIFAPLANRLGMVRVKTELEDLAMMWLYPAEYENLSDRIEMRRREREDFVRRSIAFLRSYLAEHGIRNIEITGRPKHFYSIFAKMRRDHLSLDEVFDLNALRIICDSKNQCYEIMGLIHGIWHARPGRFKDYIGTPKPNGYQSLHTTVIGYEGVVTEIQIRTREMHEVAEYGIAAHWMYKEGHAVSSPDTDKQLEWLRRLSEWIQDPGDPNSMLDMLKKDVFADVVLIFTPKGDVIELPAGATPIDLAYAIHTDVGHTCTGAKVNRRIVSLREKLKHGDTVEILTQPNGHPSREWLDVVVTGRARSKIRHYLKSREMARWVSDGWEKLNRILEDRNIHVTKAELKRHMDEVLEGYRLKTIDDLLAEIGFGTISPMAALTRMNPEWSRPQRSTPRVKRPRKPGLGGIRVDGMEGIQVRLAQCCKPIPGDEVVGFITRGRGISIHKRDCASMIRLSQDEEERARMIPAHWEGGSDAEMQTVYVRVEATDRTRLLADLSNVFADRNISITGSSTRSDKDRGTATVVYSADVNDSEQLNALLQTLRDVPSVTRAQRVNRMP